MKTTAVLKRTRYLWLKNLGKLTAHQQTKLNHLSHHKLKTGRAYRIKLTLQELFNQPDRQAGEKCLKRWYFLATHSRLQPVIEATKAKARGYRTTRNLITMAYFIAGKLSLQSPTWKSEKPNFRAFEKLGIGYACGGKLYDDIEQRAQQVCEQNWQPLHRSSWRFRCENGVLVPFGMGFSLLANGA